MKKVPYIFTIGANGDYTTNPFTINFGSYSRIGVRMCGGSVTSGSVSAPFNLEIFSSVAPLNNTNTIFTKRCWTGKTTTTANPSIYHFENEDNIIWFSGGSITLTFGNVNGDTVVSMSSFIGTIKFEVILIP